MTQTRKTVSRVVKIPIEYPKPKVWDKTWVQLRRLAMNSASFANEMLNEKYAQAKGLSYEKTAYKDWNEELGSYTRDAVSREVQGMWKRNGKNILRGDQTLGRFTADRCLCCRERGVKLTRGKDGAFSIKLVFEPKKTGQEFVFNVYMPAVQRDDYLKKLIDKLASEVYPITKATVVFERPGRKVFLMISYSKSIVCREGIQEGRIATVQLDCDGLIYVSSEGQVLTLGNETHQIRSKKEHFEGIQRRLKACLGQRGSYDRMRQVMKNTQSFSDWAQGPIHNMSRRIVNWCSSRGVSLIVWNIPDESGLPSHQIYTQCQYKCEEAGISVRSQTQEERKQKIELRKQRAIERSQAEASEDVSDSCMVRFSREGSEGCSNLARVEKDVALQDAVY